MYDAKIMQDLDLFVAFFVSLLELNINTCTSQLQNFLN